MYLPRLPCITGLSLALVVAASPVGAQTASDAMFRSYLAEHGALHLVGPLAGADEAEPTAAQPVAAARWLGDNGHFVFGGVAAVAAGLVLSQGSTGKAATPAAATDDTPAPGSTPAPVAPTTNGVKPPPAPLAPAASPVVVVNPEPGTILLLGTGLAGLLAVARRRAR